MKKILLSLGVLASISLNAQTVVNGGFEGTTLDAKLLYPTYDNSIITQGWNLIGNGSIDQTTKTEGLKSLKLVSASDAELAQAFNEPNTPGTVVPGFAIQGIKGLVSNPDKVKLSFQFKYTKVGNDVGQVGIVIQDTLTAGSADNKTLFEGAFDMDATVANWTPITISLTKKADGTANRILIVAVSSKNGYYNNTAPADGATLWLDDIKLIPGTANIDENTVSGLNVYPNPVNDVLNFKVDGEISNITIMTLDGKIVKSANTSLVNVSELNSGLYLYQIKVDDKFATGNFVKY